MGKRTRRGVDGLAGIACCAALALAAPGRAEVPDGFWTIQDEKAPATSAELRMAGDGYALQVIGICEPFPEASSADGAAITIETDHPDAIGLKKDEGAVAQARKDNPTSVTLVTGSGDQQTRNRLVCEKADAEADVDTKKTPSRGSFEASGKGCSCAEAVGNDCARFVEQIGILAAKCQRNKSVDVHFDDERQNLRKFQVKGKGNALVDR
jgi:hypothetical protein